jgi:hypothetical protein
VKSAVILVGCESRIDYALMTLPNAAITKYRGSGLLSVRSLLDWHETPQDPTGRLYVAGPDLQT